MPLALHHFRKQPLEFPWNKVLNCCQLSINRDFKEAFQNQKCFFEKTLIIYKCIPLPVLCPLPSSGNNRWRIWFYLLHGVFCSSWEWQLQRVLNNIRKCKCYKVRFTTVQTRWSQMFKRKKKEQRMQEPKPTYSKQIGKKLKMFTVVFCEWRVISFSSFNFSLFFDFSIYGIYYFKCHIWPYIKICFIFKILFVFYFKRK